ncbi:D-2-hydroxyacid dehydrogenase [Emcibacter sp. SYSU 3D8]|uniref:D-2-hydroxyacid dehydrogenase n=1 Tax=Emcibacter sp. SYSU 3D8 TaxID=3133969 RepID=UPI0031FF17E4
MKLLIYAPAYERIRDRMPQGVTPLLIHPDGSLTQNGDSIDAEDARFDIAWASTDLYVTGPSRANFALLTAARDLKWFQSGAAGFDHPIFAKVAATGTIMTRSDAQGIAIAEFVLARTLEAFQDAAGRVAKQKARQWRRHPFRDIWGTTWMVVGYGAIGREIGIRARAFGARVIGVRRTPSASDPADEMITPDQVLATVPRADVVVLAAPHSDNTDKLVNAGFITAMKDQSVLVNIARGRLVDEGALLAGLDRGKPSMAILDVFEKEPLPAESPFWDHPKVLLSAHCAADSPMNIARGDEVFLGNLERYLKGEPLRLVVDDIKG